MIGVMSWYLFSLLLAALSLPLAYAGMKSCLEGRLLLRPLGMLLWERFLVADDSASDAKRPGVASHRAFIWLGSTWRSCTKLTRQTSALDNEE